MPAAACTRRFANTRSSGGMIAVPSIPLWSRVHRANSKPVRLFPSTEGLRSCDPKGNNSGCEHWIFDLIKGREGSIQTIDVIRFLEPLVLRPYGLIDENRQLRSGSPQCSRR